jgi:cytochrome c oxidase subunit I+III
VVVAAVCIAGALGTDIYAQVQAGLRPNADSYAAMTYLAIGLQGQLVVTLVIAAGYVLARYWAGLLDNQRRLSFETTYLLWLYAVGQGLFGLLLTNGFPRLVAT